MTQQYQNRLVAWGGLALALVAVLVLEYHGAASEKFPLSPASRQPSTVQTSDALVAPGQPQADLGAILARPLFLSTRRPPPAEAPASAAGFGGLPRLTGVLVSHAGKSVIFAGEGDGKPVVVAEGGRIGPYLVQSIDAGEAVVVGPEGPRTIRPGFGTAGTMGQAAALPVSAPAQPSILDQLLHGPPPVIGIPGLQPLPTASNALGAQIGLSGNRP